MIIVRFPAPALSHLRPALRLAGLARSVVGLQERRALRAAARGRRATPYHSSAAPDGLGRPRDHGRADPAPAGKAPDAPAGHSRHVSGSRTRPPVLTLTFMRLARTR